MPDSDLLAGTHAAQMVQDIRRALDGDGRIEIARVDLSRLNRPAGMVDAQVAEQIARALDCWWYFDNDATVVVFSVSTLTSRHVLPDDDAAIGRRDDAQIIEVVKITDGHGRTFIARTCDINLLETLRRASIASGWATVRVFDMTLVEYAQIEPTTDGREFFASAAR